MHNFLCSKENWRRHRLRIAWAVGSSMGSSPCLEGVINIEEIGTVHCIVTRLITRRWGWVWLPVHGYEIPDRGIKVGRNSLGFSHWATTHHVQDKQTNKQTHFASPHIQSLHPIHNTGSTIIQHRTMRIFSEPDETADFIPELGSKVPKCGCSSLMERIWCYW